MSDRITRKIETPYNEEDFTVLTGPPPGIYASEEEYQEDIRNNFEKLKRVLAEKKARRDNEEK